MEIIKHGKIEKVDHRHAPEVSKQTGFPSPATHYLEPTINLHQELVLNSDATFFIRVKGRQFLNLHVDHNDVLIVDRSLPVKRNTLILAIIDGEFELIRLQDEPRDSSISIWGTVTYIIHRT
ncbi:Protein ImpA [Flagellimonas maritima]|uniref:Protein ImpA n=1 Tax=Flagellimonas maritima TaxID=1383885 RepID=A0A2Z4LX68_9FLAO|nr:S24 family peptidase [Allomuricauda aurantiaca]AWX46320.1 Protein ImpA [Allomuricauda aurantiaca]